jgi:hypothetical protein
MVYCSVLMYIRKSAQLAKLRVIGGHIPVYLIPTGHGKPRGFFFFGNATTVVCNGSRLIPSSPSFPPFRVLLAILVGLHAMCVEADPGIAAHMLGLTFPCLAIPPISPPISRLSCRSGGPTCDVC